MATVRYNAIKWAREVPTLLHRGRVDRLGHHLLLVMASYAKNDGSDMYASVTSLAKDVHDAERDVVDALGRLETAGWIRRAHASNGAPGWSLNLDARAESDAVAEDRLARRRAADRERQRRRRKLLKESSHAQLDRDVTHELPVTSKDVTQELGVSHAEVDRDKANVTQELGVSHASTTVTTAGQTGCNSLELHKDLTPKDELPADADASGEDALALGLPRAVTKLPARDVGGFDRFWANYPRKDNKANARKAWSKAAKAHGAELLIAEAERWAGLWQAAGRDKGYIPMPTTWLNGERWTDESPAPRINGRHVPFRDHRDDEYDQGWGPA